MPWSIASLDTRAIDLASAAFDQHLSRRPANSFSLSLDRRWPIGFVDRGDDETGQSLALSDRDCPSGRLGGYGLLDLRAAMPLGQGFELYARLDNALDERYEMSYGYSSYGKAAGAGVKDDPVKRLAALMPMLALAACGQHAYARGEGRPRPHHVDESRIDADPGARRRSGRDRLDQPL